MKELIIALLGIVLLAVLAPPCVALYYRYADWIFYKLR